MQDSRSFDEFYIKEYQPMLALARVLTGDSTRAEDVTHDAFTAALEMWNDLENPERWIRKVLANKAHSDWRRRYTERRAVSRLASGVEKELPEDTEEFWAQVRSLPRRQAQAVALFYLEDRPVAEIANILECEESTVRVHLMRGRRALSERLRIDE